jgi:HSP20 family molecular chaperone IbpA
MTNLARYHAANLPELFERINRNSIGLDDYLHRFWDDTTTSKPSFYPPYNLVQINDVLSKLEIALAGFKKDEVEVYTEFGKLSVEGQKEEPKDDGEFVHKGLAQRSFTKQWTLSDDTEVRSVSFEDGLLTVELGKVVPEHHQRKNWF